MLHSWPLQHGSGFRLSNGGWQGQLVERELLLLLLLLLLSSFTVRQLSSEGEVARPARAEGVLLVHRQALGHALDGLQGRELRLQRGGHERLVRLLAVGSTLVVHLPPRRCSSWCRRCWRGSACRCLAIMVWWHSLV